MLQLQAGCLPSTTQDPPGRSEKLGLSCNSIDDEAAAVLANAVTNDSRLLRELDLGCNLQHITTASWLALFWLLLQNPNSVLEKLDLIGSHITDEVAAALTNTLTNNSRLQKLDLIANSDTGAMGWDCAIPIQNWKYLILRMIPSTIMS
jgi:hypothetical protein